MRTRSGRATGTTTALVAAAGLLLGCSVTSTAAPAPDGASALPTTSITGIAGAPTTGSSAPPSTAESTAPATPSTVAAPPTTVAGRVGVFVAAQGSTPVVGSGPVRSYSVAVEESLGVDPAEVAGVVDRTLADPRSWIGDGSVAFQRVTAGADIEIIVASPATVDSRCLPLNTIGRYSCRSGRSVNINSDRWSSATSDWTLGIDSYRSYVINHEVGHALGHDHRSCPGDALLAPVMMQQTKGLSGCIGNPWPFPEQPVPEQ